MVEFEADERRDRGMLCRCRRSDVICLRRTAKEIVEPRRVPRPDAAKTPDEKGVAGVRQSEPASIPDWPRGLATRRRHSRHSTLGRQTAASVLAAYKMPRTSQRSAAWTVKVRGAPVLAENLRIARVEAYLYRTLATLRIDAALPESLADLCWRGPDESALATLGAQIGDEQLLDRALELRAN
jgi:hypothetical protein